jgi:hypothetical protein
MDSVRGRLQRDYQVNNVTFDNVNTNNNNNRRDRISGTARGDGGRRGSRYQFDCDVNMNNGSVRNVTVRRN